MPVLARAVDVRRLRLDNIRLREAVGIHEVSTAIARSLDSATVLDRLADAAFQQSRAGDVRVYVTTAAGTGLMLAAARSRTGAPPLGTVQPVTEAVAAWVPRQREWLDGGELDTNPPQSPDPSWLPPLLSVPMLVDGRFTGLLAFEASGPSRPMRAGQIKALSVLAGRAPPRSKSRRCLEHLRRSNEDLRKFAWAASHDLQEPLREVALNTQLLTRHQGRLDAESSALAEAAAAGARRMLGMVQELRAFVEAGATALDAGVAADSGAALDRAVADLQDDIAGSGAGITRGALPVVRMREADLTQVSGACSTTRSNSAARHRASHRNRGQLRARRAGRSPCATPASASTRPTTRNLRAVPPPEPARGVRRRRHGAAGVPPPRGGVWRTRLGGVARRRGRAFHRARSLRVSAVR